MDPSDSSSNTQPTTSGARQAVALWVLRGIGLAGLAISAYLAWVSATGGTAVGCGRGGVLDCHHVLRSRWSTWLGVPVSLAAVSLWLAVLLTTVFGAAAMPAAVKRLAWVVLATLTSAAAVAAAWFVALQVTMLGHLCAYCLAAHACALAAWVVVMVTAPIFRLVPVIAGMTLAAIIPAGQYLVPPSPVYEIHRVPDEPVGSPFVVRWLPAEAGSRELPSMRRVAILGGTANVSVAELPHLGDEDAPLVVVKLFDYACFHCRKLHHELLEAQQRYNGRLTVVLLPVPMSHECNDLIERDASTSEDACELTRLALIVWHLEPGRFAEFDQWLFEPEDPRTYAQARQKAAELVTLAALDAAEKDPAFDRQIESHIELYAASPAELVPQIIGRNTILSAQVESVDELLRILETEFGMAPR